VTENFNGTRDKDLISSSYPSQRYKDKKSFTFDLPPTLPNSRREEKSLKIKTDEEVAIPELNCFEQMCNFFIS
jgi:hypothetical protein